LLVVAVGVVPRCRSATVSDEFDRLDATEKAATKAALNRCRAVAAKIESELHNKKPEHFVDKLSLADFYASIQRAADVLGQESQKPIEDTPAPAVKGSQVRGRKRHR
jgi:glutathione S-transferase